MKRIILLVLCIALIGFAGCTKPAPGPDADATPQAVPAETDPSGLPLDVPENTSDAVEATAEPEGPGTETANPEPDNRLHFETTTLYGEAIDDSIFANYDLIIVNCWAEYCRPCISEMPSLEKIHQQYPRVLILGLLVSTLNIDEAKATLESTGVTYPVLEPQGGLTDYANRLPYIPATYFFDRSGVEIGDTIVGAKSYDEWIEIIEGFIG